MNRIYRLVWNRALGTVQVASELARATCGGTQGTSDTPLPRSRALALACATALGLALSLTPVLAAASCNGTAITGTGSAGTAGADGASSTNGFNGQNGTNGGDAAAAGSNQVFCVDTGSQAVGGSGGTAGYGGDGSGIAGRPNPAFGGNGGTGGNGGYGIRGTTGTPEAFTLYNYGSITGGTGGNGGGGGLGIANSTHTGYSGNGSNGGAGGTGLSGAGLTLTNTSTGTITGGAGGEAGRAGFHSGGAYGEAGTGGQGGAAVRSSDASTITNSGSIIGGAGGAGNKDYTGSGRGGNGGAGVTGDGFSLTNTASITGGAGGAGGYAYPFGTGGSGGNGGAGILGSNLTISNAGTISGGQAGMAAIPAPTTKEKPGKSGSSGDAVHFTGGSSTLTLQSGSVLNGAVEIDSGSTATINANDAGLDLDGGTLGSNALIVNGTAQVNVNTSAFAITGNTRGNGTLNIAGTGAITLGSVNVNALNSSASTTLDNDVTTSGGGQTYTAPVILGAPVTTSDTQGGSIDFSSTIDGPHDLTVSTSGTTNFEDAIGGTSALTDISVTSADILLNKSWNISGTATLTSAGTIAQMPGAALSAGLLTGSSVGSTTLDTGTNAIQQIGSFSANGFSLVNSQALAVVNDSTLDGGTGDVSLSTTSGNLYVYQGAAVTGANITFNPNGFTDLFGTLSTSGTTTSNSLLQVETGSAIIGNLANNGGISFVNSNSIQLAGDISGSGSLATQGSGVVTLTGDNTYAGNTIINGGSTLQLGNGGTTGWITGNVIDNGTLAFDRSDAVTFSTALTGSGALVQQGGGTLILTGNNTFSGGVQINAGSLTLGSTGALGTGLVSMAPGTTVTFAAPGLSIANNFSVSGDPTFDVPTGQTDTISGVIADGGSPGTVEKTDGGTLILTAANTYSGNTDIDGGTLALTGSGSIANSSVVNVSSGTTFDISSTNAGTSITSLSGSGNVNIGNQTLTLTSASGTFSGSISGNPNGGLTLNGGTETLTASNPIFGVTTINAGTLVLSGAGDIFHSSDVNIAAGGTLDVSGANIAQFDSLDGGGTVNLGGQLLTLTDASGNFSGVLEGTGGLALTAGTETLSGANTYTGATTVSGGATLYVSNASTLNHSNGLYLDHGTLHLSGIGLAGSLPIILSSGGGTLVFDETSSNNTTLQGQISGSGGLSIESVNQNEYLTLDNSNNQYLGGTTIASTSDGQMSVDVAATGALGSGSVTIGRNGSLSFFDAFSLGQVSAGSQTINLTTPTSLLAFGGDTTADLATINLLGGGYVSFNVGSDAGQANINVGDNAEVLISSTAGNATIRNSGQGANTVFENNATAGSAKITNTGQSSYVMFFSGSTAGNASIANDGTYTSTNFEGGNGGNATITNSNGGSTIFNSSDAGSATVIANNGGSIILEGTSSAANATFVNNGALYIQGFQNAPITPSIGSLSGSGNIYLSSNYDANFNPVPFTLTLGGLNQNDTISGIIADNYNATQSVGDSLDKTGTGTLTLSGNNTFSGGVQIDAGAVAAGSNLALGTGGASMAAGTRLDFAADGLSLGNAFSLSGTAMFDVANGQTGTLAGVVSDGTTPGTLQKIDGGTLVLTAANLYSGGTTISGGILSVSSDGSLGAATGAVTLDGGTLQINGNAYSGTNRAIDITSNGGGIDIADANNAFTLSQSINSNGHLAVSGAGALVLTGTDRFGGGITIDNSTLQIGNGGSNGAIAGDIADNGTLLFNESNTVTYSSAISGNGNVIQQGAGTLVLDGSDSSAFTGTTTVANGTLQVGYSAASNATLGGNVIVDAGATLGGFGTIGGNVSVQSGGNVTPGSLTGTLTVNGDFTAAQGSVLNLFLGAPGANFQTFGTGTNMQVNGNLVLNGLTLNAYNSNMGPGIYNLFTYAGTLHESNGGIVLGSMPAGQVVQLQNLTSSKQINLIDTTGYTLNMWNANGQASAAQMGGGSGTWSATSAMWTNSDGSVPNAPMQPQPGFAVFGGALGMVNIDDSAGSVSTTGMQFYSTGYLLSGDALQLTAAAGGSGDATINVGNGNAASASTTATINSVLTGNVGLTKTDYGTLVLGGADTYSGSTTIQQGMLALANSGSIANTSHVEVDSGAIFDISNTAHGASVPWLQGSGTVSLGTQTLTLTGAGGFDGFIQGSGGLTLTNGTTQLTGANAYTGTTTIDAGAELDLLNNGSIVDSTLDVLAGGTFSVALTNTGSSIASLQGNGYVDTGLPSQTLTLTHAADTFNGVIGGYGALAVSGGTETLTGINTYEGLTTIKGGTLALSGNGSIADSHGVTINSGGTFDISATNGGTSVTALAGSGNVNLGAQTLTVSDASDQFYGSINGSGNLTVDAGTLLLYGANTYTGSTTINTGAYVISENAQALSSTTAFHLNGGELDVMSSSLTTSAAMTLGVGTNTIGIAAPYTVQLDGQISGSGGLALTGLGGGTLILTNGNNSYQGGTTISNQLGSITALEVKATGALGSGDVTVGASSALDFIGTSGNIVSAGSRTITVDNGGNISFGNNSTLGSATLNMANGAQGTIGGASVGDAHINNSGMVTLEDANSGNAVLTNVDGLIAFMGNNDMSSATVVNNAGGGVFVTGIAGDDSTLSIGSLSGDGEILLGTNADANNNPLPLTLTLGGLNQNDTIGGVIDDSLLNNGQSAGDSVTKIGAGTLTLTGNNTYTGVTTVSDGILQIGNGGTSGSLVGNINDNATLVFNRSDAVSYSGTITGNGSIVQQGPGTLTLDGSSGAFAGTTTVANGSLIVGSTVGNSAVLGGNVIVNSGATLSGLGTIGGNVSVQAGGSVTPGAAFGALGVNGDFSAAQNSALNLSLGTPALNYQSFGSGTGVVVGGNLTLDGMTLNVTDAGGMGPGIYNVFTYGGTLSESNGGITLGSTPAGQTLQLQNLATSKQINLIDTGGLTLNVWNANGQATSSQMGGGSGTWSVISQMWTDANGDIPNVAIQPQPGFAVLGGTAGTVTVDNSAGQVSAAGMQFDVGGYTLTGDALNLIGANGSAPVIRVGDGSSAGASMTATLNNVITGSDGLVKSDLGTLVLAGNNTYTGGTTINAGRLQIGNGGSTGAIVGNVVNDGALLFDRSDAVSFGGVISGNGSLSQIGAGSVTLTSANTYTGSTSISAGTLALAGAGSIAHSSGLSVTSGAVFDISAASGGGVSIASLNGGGSVDLGNRALALIQANGNFSGVISGSGGVTLVSGNQTLSGANTYTGVTTIDKSATLTLVGSLASSSVVDHGTLAVSASASGASMSNLSGDGGVVLGGKLTLGNLGNGFTGIITGTGGLVLSGGSGTLTGINTYSGGTTIDNSTLSVSNDANLGALTGALTINGGTLNVTGHTFTGTARPLTLGNDGGELDIADAANTFTLGQSLGGAGALTKSGAGSLVLTDNNSYGGGTTINAGSLQIGHGGTTGSITGNVINNGTLIFDRSDALSFSGAISGSGSLIKESTGTLTLTGTNRYTGTTTINAGTLVADSTSLPGAVTDNAALVFNQAGQGTFNGAIDGNGTITKTGAGQLILDSNNNHFTGSTTVQEGTLEVGDAATPSAYLGGNVTVNSDGVLRGHGTIGGSVSNSGTVWAGGSIGTLSVQGNYVQSANGVLAVEATPNGQASLVNVSGTANLAGSALVVADSGNWQPLTHYTILSAAGGVSGQFASASSNFVFLTPVLSYDSHDVGLTLQRNDINFSTVAKTPNEFAVATSFNKLSDGNVIYDALLLSNADTARKAFDQMSGEIHASIRTAIMDDEHDLRDVVTNHLLDWTQDSGGQSGLMNNGAAVWTTATARGSSHQGDGNASTLDANGSGTLLGMDAPIGDIARIGGLFDTGNLSDSIGALASSAHVHTRHAGLYASLQAGSFRLMGGAFTGWQNVNTDRHISFPSAAGADTSQSKAHTVQAYVDGSYMFTLGHGTLAPFVDLAAQRLHTNAFTESGTAAALAGHAQSDTQSYGTLGVRGTLQLGPRETVQAHASLGWQHAWGDTNATATMQLLSGSDAFTVQGLPVAPNAMAITAGLRILATPRLSVDATYNGQFAQRVNDQAAHLSLTYSF